MSDVAFLLAPLSQSPCQVYFDSRTSLAGVIEAVLQQVGPSRLTISTFSTSEAFLRRLHRLKKASLVKTCSLFLDLKATKKTMELLPLMRGVCDEVVLCQNHSKVVLIDGDARRVAIVTSQNQTVGGRVECGVILSDMNVYNQLYDGFNRLRASGLQPGSF